MYMKHEMCHMQYVLGSLDAGNQCPACLRVNQVSWHTNSKWFLQNSAKLSCSKERNGMLGTNACDLVPRYILSVQVLEKKNDSKILISCTNNSTFKCLSIVQAMSYMKYISLLGWTCMIFSNKKNPPEH